MNRFKYEKKTNVLHLVREAFTRYNGGESAILMQAKTGHAYGIPSRKRTYT